MAHVCLIVLQCNLVILLGGPLSFAAEVYNFRHLRGLNWPNGIEMAHACIVVWFCNLKTSRQILN